jgi:hypothetical protein
MLIYDDGSRYLYENKRNMDKLATTESDIYGDMTWILQKNSGSDGQLGLIDTIRDGFCADFHGENLPPRAINSVRGSEVSGGRTPPDPRQDTANLECL